MTLGRRDLLLGAAALVAGCTSRATPVASTPAPAQAAAPPPKRILVLGGTGFAGPPLVRAAVAAGHQVTLFNRGKTNPGLFPEVETILGDRMKDTDKLKGRDWDAVVDTWAPGPTLVRRACELLRDHVGQYVYLSTVSVYKLVGERLDESSPVLELPPGTDLKAIKKIDASNYGALKAMAERAAEEGMPGRATCVRAGLIVGPGDPTDRFLYWPMRMQQGGDMIAPGTPRDPMEFIDVRDLGAWMVHAIAHHVTGTYDAVGPSQPVIGPILEDVQAAVGGRARIEWVAEAFLEKNEAGGWGDFPGAAPPEGEDSAIARVSSARAIAQGLTFRSAGESARDQLAWWNAQPPERRAQERPGLKPEKERELLLKWRQQQQPSQPQAQHG
jgi:2'-hydroxyisoflavone reductase